MPDTQNVYCLFTNLKQYPVDCGFTSKQQFVHRQFKVHEFYSQWTALRISLECVDCFPDCFNPPPTSRAGSLIVKPCKNSVQILFCLGGDINAIAQVTFPERSVHISWPERAIQSGPVSFDLPRHQPILREQQRWSLRDPL